MTKPGPYFGNPSVLMDVYSLEGQLKEEAAALPVAGTYKTWRKIDPPDWAKSVDLRPLDDPKLDEALLRLNRKRHKTKPPPERVRLWLAALSSGHGLAASLRLHRTVPAVEGGATAVRPIVGSRNQA
jgi:hypothetical protein